MASTPTPITTDLLVLKQGINTDIESIAPLTEYGADSYDVANMTVTALVNSPAEQPHRLVLKADLETGPSALARVVSATEKHFDDLEKFKRILRKDASIIRPILDKQGIQLDPTRDPQDQLWEHARQYKIADLTIPAGQHVIRIHASQKLLPLDGDPRRYRYDMHAPLLSLAPAGSVRLGATVVFPLDFPGQIDTPTIAPLGTQPMPGLQAGGQQMTLGQQIAYGWTFQADPIITITYCYP